MSFTFSLYLKCCFQSNLKPSSKPSKASPIVSKFWRLEFHLRLSIIWMAPPFADFTSLLMYMLGISQNTAHCFSEIVHLFKSVAPPGRRFPIKFAWWNRLSPQNSRPNSSSFLPLSLSSESTSWAWILSIQTVTALWSPLFLDIWKAITSQELINGMEETLHIRSQLWNEN